MTEQPTGNSAETNEPDEPGYVGPAEAVAIAAGNAGVSLSVDEVSRLAAALTDMGAVFDTPAEVDAEVGVPADARMRAADVLDQFAAPGEDTPGFTALREEFPDLPSRGNLKVILWRVAGALRENPIPGAGAS